jgi:acyl-CoA thioester hydrolase
MRIDIPDEKKLVYEAVIPIRWGDMDAMGHLNNGSYFRYMETVRIDWFRSIGCDVNARGEGIVIINAFCNFYKQLEYPGEVLTRMFVSNVGRSSFDTWCTLAYVGTPDVINAAGGATTVWVDFPKQKSLPIPDWLRHKIS